MITKKKLDEMQIRAQTKIMRMMEDWKLRFETGEWKEVRGGEEWQTTTPSKPVIPGQR